MSGNGSKSSVKIAIRERPPRKSALYRFPQCDSDGITFVNDAAIICQNNAYAFDRIFRSHATQTEVYSSLARPLVEQTIDGYNSTLFAYGQSGTGKSFSMGLDPDYFGDYDLMGIVPRSLETIFENIENSDGSTKVFCSFEEVYNEKVR